MQSDPQDQRALPVQLELLAPRATVGIKETRAIQDSQEWLVPSDLLVQLAQLDPLVRLAQSDQPVQLEPPAPLVQLGRWAPLALPDQQVLTV